MTSRRWVFTAVVLVLWGVVTHSTYAGSGDEPHYLAIAHSIAFDFDFDVANNYGAHERLISEGGLEPGEHVRAGIDGTLRPIHDVGLPLLFAPYVRIVAPLAARSIPHATSPSMRRLRLTPSTLYRHLLGIPLILLAGWMSVTVVRVLVATGTPQREAALWATLIALSPPLLVLSFLFFTEVLSAFLCLAVFGLVVDDDRNENDRRWLVAGLLTGLLLLVHIRNIGIVIALGGIAAHSLVKHHRSRRLLSFAAGIIPLLALRTVINYRFWGTFTTSPHARVDQWRGLDAITAEMFRRAGGLLFDQEFGLLPYAPLFALVPLGLAALVRNRPRTAGYVTGIVCLYLGAIVFPVTNAHGWTGGWSPAARFITPVLPLLGLCVVAAARTLPRALIVPLVALQITINAYFWQNPKNLWNNSDGVAAVCARGGFTFCRYLPSFVGPSRPMAQD